ncbi:hypothetical protein APR43_01260 [Flavobacterium sp. NLM]|nr:hypothetical protein AKO67_06995 [Flavobacterium sp. VMW]OWU92718.1 hypothetical protein APR43_01260 [Flavobacterium sp. NLM]
MILAKFYINIFQNIFLFLVFDNAKIQKIYIYIGLKIFVQKTYLKIDSSLSKYLTPTDPY